MKVLQHTGAREADRSKWSANLGRTCTSQSSPLQPEPEPVIAELRQEIHRTSEGRYLHRVHAVLLVSQGMSCRDAAGLLNAPARTIADWVNRFRRAGLEGLKDKAPPGRPARLSEQQIASIRERLNDPRKHRPDNGRELSELLSREFRVHLEVRQCQRLLKRLLPQR